jgi:signal peptidase I
MHPESTEITGRRLRLGLTEALRMVLMIVLIVGLTRVFVSPFQVDGRSMAPSLYDHDRIFVNRAQYWAIDLGGALDRLPFVDVEGSLYWRPLGDPSRGDIVVLDPPTGSDKPYIKRVIGLPGETVTFVDGRVYVDGVALNEPYLDGIATECRGSRWCDMGPIPAGAVFVLGDNRSNSADSRAFGPVAIDHLIGQAWFTNWPVSALGWIASVEYDADGR